MVFTLTRFRTPDHIEALLEKRSPGQEMLHLAAFRRSRWKSSTVKASTLIPPRPLHSCGRVSVVAQKKQRAVPFV